MSMVTRATLYAPLALDMHGVRKRRARNQIPSGKLHGSYPYIHMYTYDYIYIYIYIERERIIYIYIYIHVYIIIYNVQQMI